MMGSNLPLGGNHHLRLYARLRLISRRRTYPRPFTQNSRLRLLTPVNQRPQLPFLHPGTSSTNQQDVLRTQLQAHLGRFLTTATKGEMKRQFYQGLRWSIVLGLIQIIALSSYYGGGYLVTNTQHPSPSEWSFWTVFTWLTVKQFEEGGGKGTPYGTVVDWGAVASASKELLRRLEDAGFEGAGLRPISHEEGELHIDGVARIGIDISAKSEEWRRCYYKTLLGAAKAAENLEGWVADRKRMLTFPKDSVIGPTNPNPKALSGQSRNLPEPPKEEDTVGFESPDTYYMKILTTYGFTSKQRLEAALSYADWLEYKGALAKAEEIYDWGLDIALGSLPHGVNRVLDIKTGIIYKDAEHVSSNILLASSSLASYHARHGNLSAALPIYLSVLRARRKLPSAIDLLDGPAASRAKQPSIFQLLKALFTDPAMPPAPPTGDEVPTRAGAELCDEAGIISNIGEILFASSTKDRPSGLSWTREAADLAEAVLDTPAVEDKEAREKCTDCLRNAMENWTTMVERVLKDEKADGEERAASVWFWRRKNVEREATWEGEADAVAARTRDVTARLGELERKFQVTPSILAFLAKPGGE